MVNISIKEKLETLSEDSLNTSLAILEKTELDDALKILAVLATKDKETATEYYGTCLAAISVLLSANMIQLKCRVKE